MDMTTCIEQSSEPVKKITGLPALLNIKMTAEVMGVSRDFVYKALKSDDITTAVIAGKRWVLRDPLLRQLGIITD